MTGPACQIAFVGVEPSEPPRVEIRAWLTRLGPLMAPVTNTQVVIEAVDEHRKERLFRVRMELGTAEGPLAISFDGPSNAAHEDLYVAIRNAFRAARRRLELLREQRQAAAVLTALVDAPDVGEPASSPAPAPQPLASSLVSAGLPQATVADGEASLLHRPGHD